LAHSGLLNVLKLRPLQIDCSVWFFACHKHLAAVTKNGFYLDNGDVPQAKLNLRVVPEEDEAKPPEVTVALWSLCLVHQRFIKY